MAVILRERIAREGGTQRIRKTFRQL
uniref:Uncharacterized protein n=1 Tax=Anguilla anguilla TaxID=7936 RepID=A0A0E9UIX1_ANGAN